MQSGSYSFNILTDPQYLSYSLQADILCYNLDWNHGVG